VVVECVKEYQKTASAQIIRSHLRDSGYQVNEVILNGKDFGVLENRTRWFMVAATTGITIDLDAMVPVCTPVRTVGEVLEQIPENDASWRDFQYLKTKAARDAEKGNGFAMQIVDPSDTSVPVLRKGYHKGGSTDPLLKHPSQEGLYRLFTAKEHARIKQIPEHLVEGMSQTKAHELLGQSVLYAPVKALFKRIGQSLESCAESQTSTVPAYRLAQATG
jgi:DNA (cytosine-5)-methyltransferase 1